MWLHIKVPVIVYLTGLSKNNYQRSPVTNYCRKSGSSTFTHKKTSNWASDPELDSCYFPYRFTDYSFRAFCGFLVYFSIYWNFWVLWRHSGNICYIKNPLCILFAFVWFHPCLNYETIPILHSRIQVLDILSTKISFRNLNPLNHFLRNKQLKLNAFSGKDPAKGVFNIMHT